jgi:membrane-associated PAP2 superfamily phosphatase
MFEEKLLFFVNYLELYSLGSKSLPTLQDRTYLLSSSSYENWYSNSRSSIIMFVTLSLATSIIS